MEPGERALTPAEMFGVVLREAKRRRLAWWRARDLAIAALPWCPESNRAAPENDAALVELMDWYDALMWALPALKAAYLGRFAPQLVSDDSERSSFDAVAFAEFVDEPVEPVMVATAGEWAPDGLNLS